MRTISLKLESTFLQSIEKVMKKSNYTTKTEFIREAIRDKMQDLEKKEALMRLERVYGAGKKKHGHITDEEVHKAGEEAVRELAKELGVRLD